MSEACSTSSLLPFISIMASYKGPKFYVLHMLYVFRDTAAKQIASKMKTACVCATGSQPDY